MHLTDSITPEDIALFDLSPDSSVFDGNQDFTQESAASLALEPVASVAPELGPSGLKRHFPSTSSSTATHNPSYAEPSSSGSASLPQTHKRHRLAEKEHIDVLHATVEEHIANAAAARQEAEAARQEAEVARQEAEAAQQDADARRVSELQAQAQLNYEIDLRLELQDQLRVTEEQSRRRIERLEAAAVQIPEYERTIEALRNKTNQAVAVAQEKSAEVARITAQSHKISAELEDAKKELAVNKKSIAELKQMVAQVTSQCDTLIVAQKRINTAWETAKAVNSTLNKNLDAAREEAADNQARSDAVIAQMKEAIAAERTRCQQVVKAKKDECLAYVDRAREIFEENERKLKAIDEENKRLAARNKELEQEREKALSQNQTAAASSVDLEQSKEITKAADVLMFIYRGSEGSFSGSSSAGHTSFTIHRTDRHSRLEKPR